MGGGVGGGNGIRNITALPAAIARGGRLTITVDGCRNGGTASSPAFLPAPLRPVDAASEAARGIAIVRPDARPGTYDITANCAGRPLTRPAAFTVVGGVNGGVGGGTTTGATKADLAVGGGLMAAGVLGGGVFLLRRRSGKQRV
ncbi:hypothetical protein [Streptomyces sp. NPDC018610]|uniref:hypothetical protein n=1 Tax=Streptomyces sp. NPDC018610 TaxID=3365049 RepID=UPI0037B7F2B6